MTKEQYEHAKKNGCVDRLRGDEISRRIAKVYPLNTQIAILMDKDTKPSEWQEYQSFREQIKSEVDAEMSAFEN